MPRGVCTLEQATLALRADGLARVGTPPEALAAEVLAEVRALLG